MHRDTALLPTSRAGERLLLGRHVCKGLFLAPCGEAPRGRERCAGRCVELARVVHLDDLHRIEQRRGDFGQVHHEHRPDREVRRDDAADMLLVASGLELVDISPR